MSFTFCWIQRPGHRRIRLLRASSVRCGWCHTPPIASPPVARASCSGVTVSAPWPIATEGVSPAYHFVPLRPQLPFLRRHQAFLLVRQIDSGRMSEAHHVAVKGEIVDPRLGADV